MIIVPLYGWTRPPFTSNEARSKKHYHELNTAKKEVHDLVGWMCRLHKVPRLTNPAAVVLVWVPPDRRIRDGDSCGWALKACLDGLVHSGVLPGDDSRFVPMSGHRIDPPATPPRMWLELQEMPAAGPRSISWTDLWGLDPTITEGDESA